MAQQGLIDPSEAESAEIGIIHAEVVSFKTGAISIEVTRERFNAHTEDATAFEGLRDLVLGTFGRLSHTPVGAMGLNRSTHHSMPTKEAWDEIGHRLLPKEPWIDVLTDPGTRDITVEGRRTDGRSGYIRVVFQPSSVFPEAIFQLINDHFQFNDGDSGKNITASDAMEVLAESWDDSLERAQGIAEHLLRYA